MCVWEVLKYNESTLQFTSELSKWNTLQGISDISIKKNLKNTKQFILKFFFNLKQFILISDEKELLSSLSLSPLQDVCNKQKIKSYKTKTKKKQKQKQTYK